MFLLTAQEEESLLDSLDPPCLPVLPMGQEGLKKTISEVCPSLSFWEGPWFERLSSWTGEPSPTVEGPVFPSM